MRVLFPVAVALLASGAAAQESAKVEVVAQIGHSAKVNSAAFSVDGRSFLSGSEDNTLKLWDTATGQLVRTFEKHSEGVRSASLFTAETGPSVAFSPDGRTVLSGSWDKTFKLWNAATGRLLRTFEGHSERVPSVAFSPDGRIVLSASWDKTIKFWDTATGQQLRSLEGHSERVDSATFSPNGRSVLSASRDKTLRLWSTATGQQLRTFGGHAKSWLGLSDVPLWVAFSPDGRSVFSGGSWDNTFKSWDTATGQLLRTFEVHSKEVEAVAFSPDGRAVLSGSSDKTLRLWDVATAQLLRIFEGHSEAVNSVAFSPDGQSVLSGSSDQTLRLWDVATGRLLRTFAGHAGGVLSVAFSPDGHSVLSGSRDQTLTLWDVATGRLLRTFEGHTGGVLSVAFSPDGRRALSGSQDTTLKLWDTATGQLLRTFEGHSGTVNSATFSPDGRSVLSGSRDKDKTLKLWDAVTGRLLRTFEGQSDWVLSVAFSPDGRTAIVGSLTGDALKLWDVSTGRSIRTIKSTTIGSTLSVRSVRFSPDGRHILSGGSDKTLRLWDVATGRLVRSFGGHSGSVRSVALASDGRTVLSASSDNSLKFWNAATGQLLRSIEGHSEVFAVAFSPDGRSALSSGDKTLKLWDAASGQLIRTFQGHSDVVLSVAFSPDGRSLVTLGADATVKRWDAAAGRLLWSARTNHTRSLFGLTPSVAFSPDGRSVAGSGEKGVKFWDAATGQLLRTFFEADWAIAVAFSPDGRSIASSVGKGVKLWDPVTGRLRRTFVGGATAVAFSPDGRSTLLANGDQEGRYTLKLWENATGQLLRTFEGNFEEPGIFRFVHSVAFSPDGRTALSGSSDKTIKLWDTATGGMLRTFRGHSAGVNSIAFSPDGRRILSGSKDATVRLWDVATGRLERVLEGHSGSVTSVAFSPGGDHVVSAGLDGTVRVWSLATGREVVRLLASTAGDHLALIPAGFFNSKGDVDKFVHLVRGMSMFSISQIHQSLYNPDLVREALAGDPSREVTEAAKVINLETVVGSGPAPGVVVVSPTDGRYSATDLVAVDARIEDRGKGVGRIEWRVNGITAAVAAKPTGNGPVYAVTRQLALDAGDNTIEVVAYNGSNLLASLPARTTVKFTGPADKTKPKLHILAIGINRYVDKGWGPPGKSALSFEPLGLAVKDATAFADTMRKAGSGLYDDVRVTRALDQDATRDNLHKLVNKIAAQIHPRDTFILFAAAHGFSEDGRFYLIPQDYQHGPPGTLARRGIGQGDLQDWLANRIKAKRALVLLDTCESGALVAGHSRSRTDSPASEAGIGRLHEATGRPVLTAAAAGQFAYEGLISAGGQRHGVFTWAVLDALHKGDTNGNGTIELSELVAHVQRAVPEVAATVRGRGLAVFSVPERSKQSARFGSRGEDFAVARRLN